MKAALVDVDQFNKKKRWPNLAIMKNAALLKSKGHKVEWHNPLKGDYDIIYASKIFNFTPDYPYFPDPLKTPIVTGGSGYDLASRLTQEAEDICPDYSIYGIDYALGFTSRGCIRKCLWCIVPIKEGKIRPTGDIYSFWTGQKEIVLLDNNLTALPDHFELILQQCIKEKLRAEITQGLDIRLIDHNKAALLKQIRHKGRLHFAWDSLKYEKAVRVGIDILKQYFHPDQLTFYVLVGHTTTHAEDIYRVQALMNLGVNPFVMPYNKKDLYQSAFARWCNHVATRKSCSWYDYKHGRWPGYREYLKAVSA